LVAAEENGDKKNGGGKKIDLITKFWIENFFSNFFFLFLQSNSLELMMKKKLLKFFYIKIVGEMLTGYIFALAIQYIPRGLYP
jgi:hypothetical protein